MLQLSPLKGTLTENYTGANNTMPQYTATVCLGGTGEGRLPINVDVSFNADAIHKISPFWHGANGHGANEHYAKLNKEHPQVSRWLQNYGQDHHGNRSDANGNRHYSATELAVDSVVADTLAQAETMGLITARARSVYTLLSTIPAPFMVTYGDLARFAGMARASRAVGTMMRNNPFYILIPCHRVIPSSLVPKLVPVETELMGQEGLIYMDDRAQNTLANTADDKLGGYFPGAKMKRYLIENGF